MKLQEQKVEEQTWRPSGGKGRRKGLKGAGTYSLPRLRIPRKNLSELATEEVRQGGLIQADSQKERSPKQENL